MKGAEEKEESQAPFWKAVTSRRAAPLATALNFFFGAAATFHFKSWPPAELDAAAGGPRTAGSATCCAPLHSPRARCHAAAV